MLRNDRHQGLTLLLSRLGVGDEVQSGDDSDSAVRLMTIHKAKAANAQAEVVFLAGAVEGRFPAQWTRPELAFELPFGACSHIEQCLL